jgi:hypothetical protein
MKTNKKENKKAEKGLKSVTAVAPKVTDPNTANFKIKRSYAEKMVKLFGDKEIANNASLKHVKGIVDEISNQMKTHRKHTIDLHLNLKTVSFTELGKFIKAPVVGEVPKKVENLYKSFARQSKSTELVAIK